MEPSTSFSLAEIKKALTKHNKELDNDIKVRITPDGLKFSSAKAEAIAIENTGLKKLATENETEKAGLKKLAITNMLARDTYPTPKAKPKKAKPQKKAEPSKPGMSVLDQLTKPRK